MGFPEYWWSVLELVMPPVPRVAMIVGALERYVDAFIVVLSLRSWAPEPSVLAPTVADAAASHDESMPVPEPAPMVEVIAVLEVRK